MDIMLACSVLSVLVRQDMGPVGKGAIQHDTLQVYPVTVVMTARIQTCITVFLFRLPGQSTFNF